MHVRVATIISRMFEPLVVVVVVTFIGILRAGLSGQALALFLAFFMGMIIAPVVFFRFWLVKTKKTTWDIHERKKRIVPLLALGGFALVHMVLVARWNIPELTNLFVVFLSWLVGFFIVTLFWKISGHAGVAALGTGLVVRWFGQGLWPVLLIVPVVGWARVVRRDHTVGQVIMGALYSWAVVWFLG